MTHNGASVPIHRENLGIGFTLGVQDLELADGARFRAHFEERGNGDSEEALAGDSVGRLEFYLVLLIVGVGGQVKSLGDGAHGGWEDGSSGGLESRGAFVLIDDIEVEVTLGVVHKGGDLDISRGVHTIRVLQILEGHLELLRSQVGIGVELHQVAQELQTILVVEIILVDGRLNVGDRGRPLASDGHRALD